MAYPGRTVATSLGTNTPGLARTTTGTSGTVHHLGPMPVRPGITPFTNLQQGILAMSMAQKASTAAAATRGSDSKPLTQQSSITLTSRTPTNSDPSPRKKIKLEEVAASTAEIATSRRLILDEWYHEMREIKAGYMDHLTECFFLQNGGQMMDYHVWMKRPTQQLGQFLQSGRLDSDDEDDNPLLHLQERKINEEVKVLTTCGSNVPLATPVAISTTLPASVVALSHQGGEGRPVGGRHGMVYGHIQPPPALSAPAAPTVALTRPASSFCRTVSLATTTVTTATSAPHSSSCNLHRSVSDSRLITLTAQSTKTVMSTSASNLKKSPPGSPGRSRKHSSSSFDGIKGITSQEAIVERAKQEAQVMSRVSELRKDGLWSSRRLPKVQEPTRNKAHWDYLLEEMQWLAADFLQERKWKKAAARKVAKMVQKHFQDLEQKELKAEREEGMKLKRIAGQMAKMIKEFWLNIEKVVQYKQTSRLDEKRKKALDLHLNFIVDQTEKYSSWLTEGLAQSSKGSSAGSIGTTPEGSVIADDEFRPDGSESDDEETIDKDEEGVDESETRDEVAALQKESVVPIEELLDSLPREILAAPAQIPSGDDADHTEKDKDEDAEFTAAAESDVDMEDTIDEQEKHELRHDVKRELTDLEDEGELTLEQLQAKYAAAYASDFEMSSESEDEDGDDEDDVEESTTEYEEEEEEEEVDVEGGGDSVGLEFLMDTAPGKDAPGDDAHEPSPNKEKSDPGKQFSNIAEEALSLQPKGYTLQTAEVKTEVPFLLRHTLREYQHVGLDWLATMYEKRLNGILADEMGLGKTIQTIALLAHLACDKGMWGPHLIVVPTSVMLNWEMEIKKWCPAFKILTYYGTMKERKQKRVGWTKTNAFHICITSYKLVIQDHQSFRRKKWKYFILDEAQNIKNFKSQRWQTLLNFQSLRRLLLTGTPLQNSLMELWSLMHFLMPHVFQSHREFKEWFANPLTGMIEGSHEYNESLVRRLHKVLRPFLLRRLKDDVEKQMPKKYEHVVMCRLSKRQRFLYDEFMAQGK